MNDTKVVTLQFGHKSNEIGSLYWHNKEYVLKNQDNKSSFYLERPNNTHVPACLSIDGKNQLTPNSSKSVREGDEDIISWKGNIQTYQQELAIDSLEYPYDSVYLVNECRSFDPQYNFLQGKQGSNYIYQQTFHDINDKIRKLLEAIDHVQGFQCAIDINSFWGGFAVEILQDLREECPRSIILSYGIDSSYPVDSYVNESSDSTKMHHRSTINQLLALTQLEDYVSIYIPICSKSSLWNGYQGLYNTALSWDVMSSFYDSERRATSINTLNQLYCGSLGSSMKIYENRLMKIMDLTASNQEYQSFLSSDVLQSHRSNQITYQAFSVRSDKITEENVHEYLELQQEYSTMLCALDKNKVPSMEYTLKKQKQVNEGDLYHAISEYRGSKHVSDYLNSISRSFERFDRRILHEYELLGSSLDDLKDAQSKLISAADSYA